MQTYKQHRDKRLISINSISARHKQRTTPLPLGTSTQNQIASPKLVVVSVTTEISMSQLVSASNRFGFNLFRQIQTWQGADPSACT